MLAVHVPQSDKVLISKDNLLKLVSKSENRIEFFDDPKSRNFEPILREATDKVRLYLSPKKLLSLVNDISWTKVDEPAVVRMLEAIRDSYDGESFAVCFLDALLGLKALSRVAVSQFVAVEEKARELEMSDLKIIDTLPMNEDSPILLSLIEVSKLLNVVVNLEDQLN